MQGVNKSRVAQDKKEQEERGPFVFQQEEIKRNGQGQHGAGESILAHVDILTEAKEKNREPHAHEPDRISPTRAQQKKRGLKGQREQGNELEEIKLPARWGAGDEALPGCSDTLAQLNEGQAKVTARRGHFPDSETNIEKPEDRREKREKKQSKHSRPLISFAR